MAFETYPIPGGNPDVDAAVLRVAEQHALLMPVVAKLYGAVDSAVNGQAAALNRVQAKLGRAINGNIKRQGAGLDAVSQAVYSTLGERIAEQGQRLALQSALLPRL
jgi:Zn-dependent oligopeptidase